MARLGHENAAKMVGYCKSSDPFSRMVVFEYPPNGTLYEHLHGKLNICMPLVLEPCCIWEGVHLVVCAFRSRRISAILAQADEDSAQHRARSQIPAHRAAAAVRRRRAGVQLHLSD